MLRSCPTSAGILLALLGVGYCADFSGAVGGNRLLHAGPRSHAPSHSTAHLLRVASLRGGDQPSLVGKRPVSEDSAAATATPGGPPLLSAQAPLKRIALRGGKAAEEPEPEIDETLYSRQLYVLGHDAMRKMQKSSILLIGLGGLGVEIAKDLALAGVKSLTLHDPQETTPSDFAAQFYLGEADLGIGRAAATVEKLAGLNPHVTIDVLETEVNAEVVARYSLVVCTDRIFGECVRINDACRAQGVKFIMAQTRGVFGHIFVDFGADHEVTDTNGENPAQCLLSHVSSEEVGVVSTLEDTRHNLEDGDLVQISGVQGMEGLETLPPMKVKVLGPFSFSVGDTRGMGEYKGGGTVLQVKQAARMNFKTLRQSLQDPQFTTSDYGKIDRERQLLLGFQALDSFSAQLNGYPRATHEEDHHMILELAQGFNKEIITEDGKIINKPTVDEVDAALMRNLSRVSRAELAPIASVIGSITAQEVMKGVTGKFTPINQHFVFDASEALPDEELSAEEMQGDGGRYDSQILCFGKTVHEKLTNLKYFLVGAGAIGCEVLKNWAMMGVGCGPTGLVHVTDMDTIEKSNLNRQFLFRPSDINKLKSTTAGEKVTDMNPGFKVKTYETRVGSDTEHIFGDDFFDNLHGVCNALDNVQARTYMDQRCVYMQKPLLESGTLGTKGNVQVVIPHLTESYSSSRDPPEKAIPICTLKNFPNAIEHTIQWARDDFEGVFKQAVEDAASYVADEEKFFQTLTSQPTTAKGTVSSVSETIGDARPKNWNDCIAWGRKRFEQLFSNSIKQLLFNFPLDMKTTHGEPFWAGAKRPPTPLEFSPEVPYHMDFVVAAATLRATNLGISIPESGASAKPETIVASFRVESFQPQSGVRISVTEEEEKSAGGGGDDGDDAAIRSMMRSLPAVAKVKDIALSPIEFDKDDEVHMDYVTACSNLRAASYQIKLADKHNTRFIAGKIIPAIATTTSMVCGLTAIELYKLVQNKPVEAYKNGFVNLALPFFGFSEPVLAETRKHKEHVWNLWSRIDVDGQAMTLQGFLDHFQEKYKLEVTMISCGVAMIYSMFSSKETIATRLTMTMADLATNVAKIEVPEGQRYLMFEVCSNDEEGEEVDAPSVRLRVN